MLSSRLLWRFLAVIGICYALGATWMIVFVLRWQREQLVADQERVLKNTAMIVRQQLVRGGVGDGATTGALPDMTRIVRQQAEPNSARITIISTRGDVLADSHGDASRLPNQANQPEIRSALARGEGVARRLSPNLESEQNCYAVRVDPENPAAVIVRTSLSWSPAAERLRTLRARLVGLAFIVGVALEFTTCILIWPIARQFASYTRIAQAMSAGDFSIPVAVDGQGEQGNFGRSLQQLQLQFSAQLERLRQNGDRLAIVLGAMSEGVIAVDRQSRVLFVNSAARALLEFATPNAVGRPLLECVRNRAVQETVSRAFAEEETFREEFELGSGTRRTVLIHARRLPGDPSAGVLLVLHDVSELRRLETLRQEFVANVSHELKTPLTVIKAYAETLLDGAVDDIAHNRAFVQQISEQAERLHQLILDLLSVARIESGSERFEFTSIHLAEFIDACVRRYKPAAESKSVTLVVEPSLDGLEVYADEEGLREILDNLVDNAIKYTPHGGRVSVRARAVDSLVYIDVADTGIGIPASEQQRVFERFYRVDKARSRELGGTGLGLSIVKHLVSAFGGSVVIESEVGRGTVFSVRLPHG